MNLRLVTDGEPRENNESNVARLLKLSHTSVICRPDGEQEQTTEAD